MVRPGKAKKKTALSKEMLRECDNAYKKEASERKRLREERVDAWKQRSEDRSAFREKRDTLGRVAELSKQAQEALPKYFEDLAELKQRAPVKKHRDVALQFAKDSPCSQIFYDIADTHEDAKKMLEDAAILNLRGKVRLGKTNEFAFSVSLTNPLIKGIQEEFEKRRGHLVRAEEHIEGKFLEKMAAYKTSFSELDATVAAIKKKESDARELQDSAKEDLRVSASKRDEADERAAKAKELRRRAYEIRIGEHARVRRESAFMEAITPALRLKETLGFLQRFLPQFPESLWDDDEVLSRVIDAYLDANPDSDDPRLQNVVLSLGEFEAFAKFALAQRAAIGHCSRL